MGSQVLSNTVALLGILQPHSFGFLNCVDPTGCGVLGILECISQGSTYTGIGIGIGAYTCGIGTV